MSETMRNEVELVDAEAAEAYELPLLASIAACLRWCEELVVLLSGPLLLAGLGIGLVALLSDGALLVTAPWLVYAWAISQTVGVDGQLVGAWYRVSVAVSRRRWGVAAAFAILGLLLAYVGYVAALVFATQQAYRLTTSQALAHLGMDATSWLWQRAFVSVLLVCLSGYLRYRAPRRRTPSLEEQKRAIAEHMELAALRRQQRAQQTQGAIGLLRGAVEAALGSATGGGASPATPASSAAERETWLDEVEHRERPTEVAVGAGPLPMAWHRETGGSPSPQARRDSKLS
jgi:hypothetical protein